MRNFGIKAGLLFFAGVFVGSLLPATKIYAGNAGNVMLSDDDFIRFGDLSGSWPANLSHLPTQPAPALTREDCTSLSDIYPGTIERRRSRPFWVPRRGCKLRRFEDLDIESCFSRLNQVFLGDSLTRDIFRKMGRFGLHQVIKESHRFTDEEKGPAYANKEEEGDIYGHFFEVGEGKLEFYWSAAARYDGSLNYTRTQSAIKAADVVWVGSGAWDMGVMHVNPDVYFDLMYARVARLKATMKPGAKLILFPVHWLHIDRCPVGRKCRLCNDPAKARVFREALTLVAACHGLPVLETSKVTKAAPEHTKDGLHYSKDVSLIQTDIYVNAVCSDFGLYEPTTCDIEGSKRRWSQVPAAHIGCKG
ncbi:Cas1p-domain-containing protein, partial [Diplonema papillatum]